MINFSNGHQLQFCNGSGALAFNGKGWWWEQPLRWSKILDPHAFTVVAKTVTALPRTGNLSLWRPWSCVQLLQWTAPNGNRQIRGTVNAVGLSNPGIQKWVERDYPVSQEMGYRIAASVWPDSISEAMMMRVFLENLDLAYIEVNLSCPNVVSTADSLREILNEFWSTKHPVVLKLGSYQVDPEFIAHAEPYVEAFHAINTVPWDEIFKKESPLEKYPHGQQGGVGGEFIHPIAIKCVRKLRNMTDKPIIGGGGIYKLEDVYDFEKAGAQAFSIGSLFMVRPWKPNQIVRDYKRN